MRSGERTGSTYLSALMSFTIPGILAGTGCARGKKKAENQCEARFPGVEVADRLRRGFGESGRPRDSEPGLRPGFGAAGKPVGSLPKKEEVVPILHRDDTTEAATRLTRSGRSARSAGTESVA